MRLAGLIAVLALAVVLAAPDAALAAGDAATHDVQAHGPKEGGKLDFLGLKRWDLGIYTLVVFGLLMLVLGKFAWPNIREGLAKREANVKSAIDTALADKAAAAADRDAAATALAAAHDQARGILDEARKDADALRTTEREAGVKEAAAERERVKREIAAARDAAMKELYEQAVGLASTMSAKALGRSLSADDHRRLLDESLAELKAGGSRA